MMSPLRHMLALLLALVLVACSQAPFNMADRGIGGTGISNERGMGGTGVRVADRGIGGTGIVGTVTGFGSIWVNGLEVEVPQGMAVSGPIGEMNEDAIRIGHVVEVMTEPGPTGLLEAKTISLRPSVVGFVAEDLTVNGQTVRTQQTLQAGSRVAVYGLVQNDGTFEASLVEPVTPEAKAMVRGRVRVDETGNAMVGGLDVPDDFAAGDRVTVVGDVVSATPDNPFGAKVSRLSVERMVKVKETVERVVTDYSVKAGVVERAIREFRQRALPGQQANPPGASGNQLDDHLKEQLKERLKDFMERERTLAPSTDAQSMQDVPSSPATREKVRETVREKVKDAVSDKMGKSRESLGGRSGERAGSREGRAGGREGREGRGGRGGRDGGREGRGGNGGGRR